MAASSFIMSEPSATRGIISKSIVTGGSTK